MRTELGTGVIGMIADIGAHPAGLLLVLSCIYT